MGKRYEREDGGDPESTVKEDLKEWYCGDPSATDEELEEAMGCDDSDDIGGCAV